MLDTLLCHKLQCCFNKFVSDTDPVLLRISYLGHYITPTLKINTKFKM